jgi:hypothetical protein
MQIDLWSRDEDTVFENRSQGVVFLTDTLLAHIGNALKEFEARRSFKGFIKGAEAHASDERQLPDGTYVSYHVDYPENISLVCKIPFDVSRWNARRVDPKLDAPLTDGEIQRLVSRWVSDYKSDSFSPTMLEAFEDYLYGEQSTDYQYDGDDDNPVPPREAAPNYSLRAQRTAKVGTSGGVAVLLVTYRVDVTPRIAFRGERGYPY